MPPYPPKLINEGETLVLVDELRWVRRHAPSLRAATGDAIDHARRPGASTSVASRRAAAPAAPAKGTRMTTTDPHPLTDAELAAEAVAADPEPDLADALPFATVV